MRRYINTELLKHERRGGLNSDQVRPSLLSYCYPQGAGTIFVWTTTDVHHFARGVGHVRRADKSAVSAINRLLQILVKGDDWADSG